MTEILQLPQGDGIPEIIAGPNARKLDDTLIRDLWVSVFGRQAAFPLGDALHYVSVNAVPKLKGCALVYSLAMPDYSSPVQAMTDPHTRATAWTGKVPFAIASIRREDVS